MFTYSYELVGHRTWRKGSSPQIQLLSDPPSATLLVERQESQILVNVYDAFPSEGTDEARELAASPQADAALRRRFLSCSILDPNEGRG